MSVPPEAEGSPSSSPAAEPADPGPIALAISAGGVELRLRVYPRKETVSNHLRESRVWQRDVTDFLIRYLKEGDVFVDVGANFGYFSVYAGQVVGSSGRVLAIEPDAENVALLESNLALNGLENVQILRTAVSDYQGEATLYQGDYNLGSHSLFGNDGLTVGATVPVTTLDTLLKDEPKVRLIKIDVQGAEMNVLRGMMERVLRRETKPAIIVEFSPVDLANSGDLEEFLKFTTMKWYGLRAFIANDRAQVVPPQIRRATLRQIARDFLEGNDAAEFDILLLPKEP